MTNKFVVQNLIYKRVINSFKIVKKMDWLNEDEENTLELFEINFLKIQFIIIVINDLLTRD